MSATLEATRSAGQVGRTPGAASLNIRLRTRLHHHKVDRQLASGADPKSDLVRQARAQQLVGQEIRRKLAASLERLLAAAYAGPRPFTSKVPIARAAIRDSRWDLDTIVERLRAPGHISPQGVAMITVLLCDGAGPLYGNSPTGSHELRRALEAVIDRIDHGPALAG